MRTFRSRLAWHMALRPRIDHDTANEPEYREYDEAVFDWLEELEEIVMHGLATGQDTPKNGER